jgi:pimeloyl-ACP methyl ester carboxylesterase
MWTHVAAGLPGYTVVRFDFRGYGQSRPSTESYRNADDLGHVLDALKIPRAHLVGASMGGAVAMEFALTRPDRVASLALLATGLPGHDYGEEMHAYSDAEDAALASGDVEAVVEVNLEMWVRGTGRPWGERNRTVAAEVRDALRTITRNQITAEDLEEDPALRVRDHLARIDAPTLVVIAESDPADFVGIGEHVAAAIHGARAVRLADTAHLPALERPAETIALLRDWLTEVSG